MTTVPKSAETDIGKERKTSSDKKIEPHYIVRYASRPKKSAADGEEGAKKEYACKIRGKDRIGSYITKDAQ